MTFEKTKAANDERKSPEELAETDESTDEESEEVAEVETTEETTEAAEETEEESKEESTEEPKAEEANETDENSVDYWKSRAETAETERENYKTGLLAEKAGKRTISKTEDKKAEVTEAAVVGVLERQNERKVLKAVVNKKSEWYIPELVDEEQYNQIVGFLPFNLDKSAPESIFKALKIATKLWKEENGIQDKPKTHGKEATAKLAESKSSTSQGGAPKTQPKKGERKILKKSSSIENWY